MELMDCEVPDCQGVVPGVGPDQDDNRRALDDYYLTHELLELLLRRDGDAAGSSSVVAHENGASLMDDIPPLLPPPLSPLQTYHSAGNPFAGNGIPSDAEMASWLCQVFEQEATDDHEPRGAATATTTTTTTESEGGNTNISLPSSSYGTGEHRSITSAAAPTASLELAVDGPADDCRRGRSSSGRRRSCSGKAAEQRRRDKINDKMKTLQQLMPRCSKTDKASTLEEVIKYVKSLQHQVQVMSAAGYAIPTPFLPLGMMPPSCMQLPAGGQPPVMLPQYPVFPAAYACPHHGTPLPMSAPCARRPAAGEPRVAPRRHLVPNDFTVPSHSACGRSQK